jgi:hypothetical protein
METNTNSKTNNGNEKVKKYVEVSDDLYEALNEITPSGADHVIFTLDDIHYAYYELKTLLKEREHSINFEPQIGRNFKVDALRPLISSKEYHELMDKLVTGLRFSLQENEDRTLPFVVFIDKKFVECSMKHNMTLTDFIKVLSSCIYKNYLEYLDELNENEFWKQDRIDHGMEA